MMPNTISPPITSKLWIMSLDSESGDPEMEDESGTTTAEITDTEGEGEVAVHFTQPDNHNALVSIYLSRVGAIALASLLHKEAVKVDIG